MDSELEILFLKKEILELKYGANSDRLSLRYNENHDPDNGQFTSGPGGSAAGHGDTADSSGAGTDVDIAADIHATSGALNPDSPRADEHAARYYEAVRHMTTDVERIAKHTGYDEKQIDAIKHYLFLDKHDLGDAVKRFDASFEIAQSWQRLINGTPKPHDLTLLRHEIMESELVSSGMSQDEAHVITSKVYNYKEEADKFYGKDKEC